MHSMSKKVVMKWEPNPTYWTFLC
ncbi:unnamed protein product, partial [Rotaria sp. Silwood1]